ncbi:MAG: hypothetical protein AABX32_02915 [Nanoarchaeota archaeon]
MYTLVEGMVNYHFQIETKDPTGLVPLSYAFQKNYSNGDGLRARPVPFNLEGEWVMAVVAKDYAQNPNHWMYFLRMMPGARTTTATARHFGIILNERLAAQSPGILDREKFEAAVQEVQRALGVNPLRLR